LGEKAAAYANAGVGERRARSPDIGPEGDVLADAGSVVRNVAIGARLGRCEHGDQRPGRAHRETCTQATSKQLETIGQKAGAGAASSALVPHARSQPYCYTVTQTQFV